MGEQLRTLWMFQYHLGTEKISSSTVMYLEFFYARDQQEAEALRDTFLASLTGTPIPELLQPCEQGVRIVRRFLPGKKLVADECSTFLS